MAAAPGALSMAKSYPTSEVRGDGLKEIPCARGQGQRPGGATLRQGQGSDREEQPHVQGVVAAWAQEGLEEPSHTEWQEGLWEEIPLIQGKEQQLCFAGAAMKRYPTPKVSETQVRW